MLPTQFSHLKTAVVIQFCQKDGNNEAGKKPTFEDMVLLMHAEVEKDNSKDTFASDDDAHKADMGPGSHVLR